MYLINDKKMTIEEIGILLMGYICYDVLIDVWNLFT